MARPDRSGRVTERSLLRALRWGPGHRLDIDVSALLIGSAADGQHLVGSRCELHLPGSARQMCGMEAGQQVLLAALVAHDLPVIHPASTVARLLTALHTEMRGGRHAG